MNPSKCQKNLEKPDKSSHPEVFLGACNIIKTRLWYRCFPMNFVKFLINTFFKEHLRWLLLTISFLIFPRGIIREHFDMTWFDFQLYYSYFVRSFLSSRCNSVFDFFIHFARPWRYSNSAVENYGSVHLLMML